MKGKYTGVQKELLKLGIRTQAGILACGNSFP
jgi:hypothetical protein